MRHFAFTSILPAIALLLLSSDQVFGAAVPIVRRASSSNWKATDLKASGYRQTALKHNNGAYMPTASGSKVAWKKGANGDAEHVIGPGSHIKPVLNQMGIQKNSPFHEDLKAALNHKDDLSVLYPRANKAKAHLMAGSGRNPKHKAAAKHYIQQRPIQHKASATMNKIKSAAKRHKVKNSFVAKPSSKVTNPKNGGTVAANKPFTISMPIDNHKTGNFVNAQQNHFAAPQQLNNQGVIHGHSHVVVEPLTSLTQTTPTDPKTFAFFKGLNAKVRRGGLDEDFTLSEQVRQG